MPAAQRKAKSGNLPQGGQLVAGQAVKRIFLARVHGIGNHRQHPPQSPHGVGFGHDGVGNRDRTADHIGYGAVKGIGVFGAAHGFVTAAAAAVQIGVDLSFAVERTNFFPRVFRRRRRTFIKVGRFAVRAKHGLRAHVAFHKAGAVQDGKGNPVVGALPLRAQGAKLLVRAGKGRKILEKPAVKIRSLHRKTQTHFQALARKADMIIPVGQKGAVRQNPLADAFLVHNGVRPAGILAGAVQFLFLVHVRFLP